MGLTFSWPIFKVGQSFSRNKLISSACQPTILLSPYPTSPISLLTKCHLLPSHHLCTSIFEQSSSTSSHQIVGKIAMATASATLSPSTFSAAAIAGLGRTSQRRKTNVHFIGGLNSFDGLKAYNSVASLGLPVCTEQSFAKIVGSLKSPSQGKGRGGGALSSTCNAVGEIFRIAAIMNGLVLVGVAVGFVLLRIEASVEEAE
ncbi:hypothetical protein VitviT2T_003435 [Vitis vinifera]|uniref:Cytochrome b6-f complex subunit 7 n=1 Tax=Vitis vinifera TaxID=29760 RepID=A0ABY9BMP1_VITVI|nr:hypothetical protein VitviT2T_003435 [Vitis vinifera]